LSKSLRQKSVCHPCN